jgi:hypothetical protein
VDVQVDAARDGARDGDGEDARDLHGEDVRLVGDLEPALNWLLAAAFIAVGCVCFVAGLAWAAFFETRERQWLGAREASSPAASPQEPARPASVTIPETPPVQGDRGRATRSVIRHKDSANHQTIH